MIAIIGLPNSGKTTYSKNFENVVHFDYYLGRYEEGFKFLKTLEDAVIEGLFTSKQRRVELIESCSHMETKKCIWLDVPLDACMRRPGRPAGVVLREARIFEPPTLDEGWDEIEVIEYVE